MVLAATILLLDGATPIRPAWTWNCAATLRRTRHIGNFAAWTNPQAYQIAFERLLRDLKQN